MSYRDERMPWSAPDTNWKDRIEFWVAPSGIFIAREMLGPILLTHHNLMLYQRLMTAARQQIAASTYRDWLSEQRVTPIHR